tara:strand:+ start:1381 stop:1587 length:207 start_codon:yes stop_codon:yes gene_type:complete
MTNKTLVINVQTGETYEEDLSKETIAFHKKKNEEMAKEQAEAQTQAIAKAQLLAKLGITAEEAALLLG